MTVSFQLDGQDFTTLNGGPAFNFTEAISFVVNCETQEEVDHFWGKLLQGGKEVFHIFLELPRPGLDPQVGPKIDQIARARQQTDQANCDDELSHTEEGIGWFGERL